VDLDHDGRVDLISGSWPGELFLFRGGPNGTFAAPEMLEDKRGEVMNLFGGWTEEQDGERLLTGHGEIVLREGKLQQYSLLVALGQILQIDELMQLQLEQAEVKYHISPGIVTIDELLLRSPNIRLTATGTINFHGKLQLDSKLALNDKVRRQLFAPIRENFQPLQDQPGYAAVDFKVSGSVDRPKTDLMDKLVGRDLRDLGGVISSLFGHAKKKKPREETAPPPTPVPSPSEGSSPNDTPTPSPSLEPTVSPTPDEETPEPSATPAASP